jgi:hypothetical protein
MLTAFIFIPVIQCFNIIPGNPKQSKLNLALSLDSGSLASEFRGHNTDMVVNCQAVKVFPVHLFSCGYAVPYISGHMPDQNLG